MSHDVAIVGGGLVGASLACALAPLGYRVAVIEAVAPRAVAQPSYDDRALALGEASCRILAGLGLWEALAGAATPIRRVIVSELGRPGRVELHPEEVGLERFGCVVEARAFGAAVSARLDELDAVEVIRPARVTRVGSPGAVRDLEVAQDEGGTRVVQAALVAGADGVDSTLRELLGLPARVKDYGQSAVICNVTPAQAHGGRAYERLTPTGPCALLPHQGDRMGLVWCAPTAEAEALMALDDDAFLARATARSGGELGALGRAGRRSAYPLRQVLAQRLDQPRALLVGNAAHAIHPAGAQGFNLGLRDVAALAEILHAHGARTGERDPGAEAVLRDYREWRAADLRATAAWADALVSVFALASPVAGLARSLGLLAHAVSPALRRRLASRAMGFGGRVPRLALGESLEAGA